MPSKGAAQGPPGNENKPQVRGRGAGHSEWPRRVRRGPGCDPGDRQVSGREALWREVPVCLVPLFSSKEAPRAHVSPDGKDPGDGRG